jgi:hypothetical protein
MYYPSDLKDFYPEFNLSFRGYLHKYRKPYNREISKNLGYSENEICTGMITNYVMFGPKRYGSSEGSIIPTKVCLTDSGILVKTENGTS